MIKGERSCNLNVRRAFIFTANSLGFKVNRFVVKRKVGKIESEAKLALLALNETSARNLKD